MKQQNFEETMKQLEQIATELEKGDLSLEQSVEKFEEGIEKTVQWYLDNQEWLNNVTSGDYQKYYEEQYKIG